jgi:DNA-binding NarL/FixJ family response regulator
MWQAAPCMNVLIIDRDPVSRATLEQAVRTHGGCSVTVADDFYAGWESFIRPGAAFDVVFLDPDSPGDDGFDLLRCIRRTAAARPLALVLCTFGADPTAAPRATEAGVRHFVFKPCAQNAVTVKLRQIESARAYFRLEPATTHPLPRPSFA